MIHVTSVAARAVGTARNRSTLTKIPALAQTLES